MWYVGLNGDWVSNYPPWDGWGWGENWGWDSTFRSGCQNCPNGHGNNNVEVQTKLGGAIIGTLTQVGGVPVGIAADVAGNAYVSAFPHNFISVYARGATTPTSTLTDTQMSSIYYIAMDKVGNLFADGWGPGGPGSGLQIDEFKKGSQQSIKLISEPGLFPGGMAIDKVGTLYVADEGNGTGGFIGVLKPPYRTVSRAFGYNGTITGIDIDKTGRYLWAANANAGGTAVAQEYDAHNGGLLHSTKPLPATFPYGIAIKK